MGLALLTHRAGWLLDGNLLVAFVAASLLAGHAVLLGLPVSWPLVAAGSGAAFVLYLADRAWLGAPEDLINRPARVAWLRRHRTIVILSALLASAVVAAASSQLAGRTVGAGVVLGGLGLAYLLPYGHRRAKGQPWLKPLAISAAWALGTVGLPLVEDGQALGVVAVVLMAVRGAVVLANVLLSDWPDRAGDARAGLRTLVMGWDWPGVRRAVVVLLVGAAVVELVAVTVLRPEAAGLWVADAAGPLAGAAFLARRTSPGPWFFRWGADLLVAWPVVPAVGAWLLGANLG